LLAYGKSPIYKEPLPLKDAKTTSWTGIKGPHHKFEVYESVNVNTKKKRGV